MTATTRVQLVKQVGLCRNGKEYTIIFAPYTTATGSVVTGHGGGYGVKNWTTRFLTGEYAPADGATFADYRGMVPVSIALGEALAVWTDGALVG